MRPEDVDELVFMIASISGQPIGHLLELDQSQLNNFAEIFGKYGVRNGL